HPPSPHTYPLSLHDALPICLSSGTFAVVGASAAFLFCGAGVSAPHGGGVLRPSVSEIRLGCAVNGVLSGFRVNAPYIGVAALSLDRKSTRLNSSHVAISYAV